MHQFNISKGIKGFFRLYWYGVRWKHMPTPIATKRSEILRFWKKHGLPATTEAFGVSRRTLYNWQAKLQAGTGHLSVLDPASRRPHQVRRRSWDARIVAEIKRLRTMHPNLGKEKVHILLQPFCTKHNLVCPSVRTIGRLIADDPHKMRTFPPRYGATGRPIKQHTQATTQRKPKDFVATYPGHCGSFDTVEEHIHGARRYVLTFTDVYSRFSFSWATTSHASRAATDFFKLICTVFPYQLDYILTDNGSEFAKEFDAEIRHQHKVHWRTYPRTPKMNAHVERFNRTLQEEFLNFNKFLLLEPDQCNAKMMDYLVWYNGTRPHWSLGLQSPIQFLRANQHECNMWWPDTDI